MDFKKFGNKYILRLDRGEEIIKKLTDFCNKENIKLGTVHGLGATDMVKIGLFNTKTKEYQATEMSGDFEIVPLYGNISTMDGKIYIHCHINLADDKHRSYGGHLNSARVSATFEAVIERIDGEVEREFIEDVGLNCINFYNKS